MIDHDNVFICPDIDVNAELSEENRKKRTLQGCYMHIREKIKTKPDNNREFKRKDMTDDYLDKLIADRTIIKNLLDRWERIKDDPKLETFMFKLDSEFFARNKNNPNSPHDQKLVIFTEAIDTVKILERKLKNTNHKVLAITAGNRDAMREVIKSNFDANYSGTFRYDYDILITTEVLAEGVNLHRSNVILNYDTPWNSTRLMQRIGRVNRIGSKEDYIYVYNFFPSSQGDAQLELVKKALTKLQAFHTLFGEDSQVFSVEEEVVSHGMVPFINDESETPSTKFIDYLKRFKTDYPDEYIRIFELPVGIHAAKHHSGSGFLFHIKANEKDTGLYYKTDNEGLPILISPIEMAELIKCNIDEPNALPMPLNWGSTEESVITLFNEYMLNAGLITSSHLSKNCKKALSFLVGLIRTKKDIADDVKQKLITARGLITQGNETLARKILKLDSSIRNSLFEHEKLSFINEFVEHHLTNIQLSAISNNTNQPYTVISVALKSTSTDNK